MKTLPPQIIIDTREQHPWTFSDNAQITHTALPTGDYSLVGYEDQIVVERKSLDDYVGSIMDSFREDDGTEGRFFREIGRLEAIPNRTIVIEDPFFNLINHRYESKISPASIISKTMSFEINNNIPVRFFDERYWASHWTEEYLSKFWRIKQNEIKNEIKKLKPKRVRENSREDCATVPEGEIPAWITG